MIENKKKETFQPTEISCLLSEFEGKGLDSFLSNLQSKYPDLDITQIFKQEFDEFNKKTTNIKGNILYKIAFWPKKEKFIISGINQY